ncbi:DUF3995 domain-containing protein [Paenibacillus oryzisoli]|uniref:DUF3995 domain-containing protein n=1 Tax=Paenibacillus oryzisoli TaxID=1850517 RepID=UPI003D26BA36
MILISFVLLLAVGTLHIYWAFGGKWGSTVAIPTIANSSSPTFRPDRIATLLVAVVVILDACLLGMQGDLLPLALPAKLVRWGCILSAIVFALRCIGDFKYVGLFKTNRASRFARYDYFLFTPLCLWLCWTFFYAL